MTMKTFSILGAGWLGLELAKTLKDQFTIKLSARNALIQTTHTELGFESYVLTEGIYNNLDALFSFEYLFINYPPSKFNDYLQFINTLSQHPRFSTIEKALSLHPIHYTMKPKEACMEKSILFFVVLD